MLKPKKRIAMMLSLLMVMSLLFIPNLNSEASNLETYSTQFSIENFRVKPIETDSEVLSLNVNAEPLLQERLEKAHEHSERAFDALIRSFYEMQSDNDKYKEGCYTVSGITAEGFPNYYSGAYINENLDLIVLLSENAIRTERTLQASQLGIAALADSNDIIYASAEYSYSHLVSLMDDIYQYLKLPDELKEDGFSIVYYFIDDYNNCVTVGLEDIGTNNITAFKNTISDSDALCFVVANSDNYETDALLEPGQAFASFSLAFRACKTTGNNVQYGFITAAHAVPPNTFLTIGNVLLAVSSASGNGWQNSGNLDAVFCYFDPYYSSNDFGTTIAYINQTLHSGIDAALAKGNPIRMVGQMTQKKGTGTVESLSFADSSGLYTDFIASNYTRANGDSGGIVISNRTSNNWISGVHHGTIGGYSVYTKAINITTVFGLSLY